MYFNSQSLMLTFTVYTPTIVHFFHKLSREHTIDCCSYSKQDLQNHAENYSIHGSPISRCIPDRYAHKGSCNKATFMAIKVNAQIWVTKINLSLVLNDFGCISLGCQFYALAIWWLHAEDKNFKCRWWLTNIVLISGVML